MKRILLTCIIAIPITLFSQVKETFQEKNLYGYSFIADIDSIKVVDIAQQVERLPGVEKAKGIYKAEKGEGYILIHTLYEGVVGREDNVDPFEPDKLKALLIENKLDPKDLKKLK